MRKVAVLFLLALLGTCNARATAQRGDILRLHGKEYSIHTNPLRIYLDSHPKAIPKSDVVSSANWRGYVATWEVSNGMLTVADITILRSVKKPKNNGFETEDVSVFSKVFPGGKPIVAEWFSGHIVVPDGELVHYIHMGYASTFERYIVLRVEKGVVIREWHMNLDEFKQFRSRQFQAYKRTPEFQKALAELNGEKNGGMAPEQNEEFLREFYAEDYMSRIFDEQR